jgi:hypothetical protein
MKQKIPFVLLLIPLVAFGYYLLQEKPDIQKADFVQEIEAKSGMGSYSPEPDVALRFSYETPNLEAGRLVVYENPKNTNEQVRFECTKRDFEGNCKAGILYVADLSKPILSRQKQALVFHTSGDSAITWAWKGDTLFVGRAIGQSTKQPRLFKIDFTKVDWVTP